MVFIIRLMVIEEIMRLIVRRVLLIVLVRDFVVFLTGIVFLDFKGFGEV